MNLKGRSFLTLVDFTKELSNPNIFLTTNIDELRKAFNLKFLWRTQTNFVFLNFHKFVFDKADLLTEREKNLIQEQIYLFTKGRGCK